MSTGVRVAVRGVKLKDGKLVRVTRCLSVSASIAQRKSKRVHVVSKAKAMAKAQRP